MCYERSIETLDALEERDVFLDMDKETTVELCITLQSRPSAQNSWVSFGLQPFPCQSRGRPDPDSIDITVTTGNTHLRNDDDR